MKKLTTASLVVACMAAGGASANEGDLLWSNTLTAGYTWSTPIALPGMVVLQDQEGGFDVFSAADGQRIFHQDIDDGYPTNSPVYANGSIFMISGNSLYRISTVDGSVIGSYTTDVEITSQSPAIYNNLVIFGTATKIIAIDYTTMSEAWSADSAANNPVNVVVAEDIAYVSADRLYALSASTGQQHWVVDSPTDTGFYIGAIKGDYFAVFDNSGSAAQLHAYQLASNRTSTPTLLWSAAMGSNSADNSPPVIDGTTVYATGREGVLRAFSLTGSNSPLWEETVRDSGSAPALPIALDGSVYIQKMTGDSAYQLVALNGSTGAQAWATSVENMSIAWGEPVIRGEKIYLATDHGGTLYAFEIASRSDDWAMIKQNPQLTGNTVAGVVSEVNLSNMTVSLPQVYLQGSGVFNVTLVPEDVGNLIFTVDLAQVIATSVPESNMAIYDGVSGQLIINDLKYGNETLDVTLNAIESLGDILRFQVVTATTRESASSSGSGVGSTAKSIVMGHDGVDFSANSSGGLCDGTSNVGWDVQDGYSISWSPTGSYISGESGHTGLVWYSNNVSDSTYYYVEDMGAVSLDSVTSVSGNWPSATDSIPSLAVGHTYVVKTRDGYAKFTITAMDATAASGCTPISATYATSTTTSF